MAFIRPPHSAEVKERMELHLYAPMRLHGRLQIEIYLHFNYCEIEPTETKYTPEQWHFYRREWAEDGHTAEQFVK